MVVTIIWERFHKKTEIEKIQTKKINHFCPRGCKLKTSLFFYPQFYFCSHTPPSFTWILRTKALATGFGGGGGGGKGKVLCMPFHMLISWFHDNHWKRRAGNKSRCERGSGLFQGLCKNNSRDSLRWKVSDGHSSKSFVLVVQSQYIINAEFYESKLQPQWCSPFKRLWIRIWNQEDLLPGGTWAVVAYQFLWSCTSVLGKKVKGFLSLSLKKAFRVGLLGEGDGKALLCSPGSLWTWGRVIPNDVVKVLKLHTGAAHDTGIPGLLGQMIRNRNLLFFLPETCPWRDTHMADFLMPLTAKFLLWLKQPHMSISCCIKLAQCIPSG